MENGGRNTCFRLIIEDDHCLGMTVNNHAHIMVFVVLLTGRRNQNVTHRSLNSEMHADIFDVTNVIDDR